MNLNLNVDYDPKKSTVFYLWEILYPCAVPWLATTSPEYIKLFGVPSTGDAALDREMGDQWIDTALSIQKMASLFKDNVPIRIKSHRHTEEIYFHVQRHLEMSAAYVQRSFNGINQQLLEELSTFDQFAQKIYPHATEYMSERRQQGGLFAMLDKMGMMNRPSLAIMANATKKEDQSPQEIAQRQGMSDLFRSISRRQR